MCIQTLYTLDYRGKTITHCDIITTLEANRGSVCNVETQSCLMNSFFFGEPHQCFQFGKDLETFVMSVDTMC